MGTLKKIAKVLGLNKDYKFDHYLQIQGWLTPKEAAGLFEISALLPKEAVVLEIGSWKGKSTWCIANGLKKGIINCIDPFNADGETGSKNIYDKTMGGVSLLKQFQTNIANIPSKVKVQIHKGYSNEFSGAIKNIDFLFIDGDHSIEGCRYDFETFEINLNINGFLAFHDYYEGRNELGPTWVVDNLLKNNSNYQFYKSYDSLFVFKKTP